MYQEEVAAGAKWLDENILEWWRDIDLETLDLFNYDTCVIGQVLGAGPAAMLCHDVDFSIAHGFVLEGSVPERVRFWIFSFINPGYDRHMARYKNLTGKWIQEVLRRRARDRMLAEVQKQNV